MDRTASGWWLKVAGGSLHGCFRIHCWNKVRRPVSRNVDKHITHRFPEWARLLPDPSCEGLEPRYRATSESVVGLMLVGLCLFGDKDVCLPPSPWVGRSALDLLWEEMELRYRAVSGSTNGTKFSRPVTWGTSGPGSFQVPWQMVLVARPRSRGYSWVRKGKVCFWVCSQDHG